MPTNFRAFTFLLLFVSGCVFLSAQTLTPESAGGQTVLQQPGQLPPKLEPGVPGPDKTKQGEDKRVLGVLPNYRTAERDAQGHALTAGQKMHIAIKDTFDYPLYLLGAAYAGVYHLENTHPQFGQGAKGYFSRFGTSYTDQLSGNMMTEGFLPVLLHQDPRYFRMATGSVGSRTAYALTRIFVTVSDSGRHQPNYSELGGNAISAGIGLSYYSDNRNVPDYFQNWGIALATDATSQVLKEFWPDVKRWWYLKHHKPQASGPAANN